MKLQWELWRVTTYVFTVHAVLYRLLGGRLVGRNTMLLTTTGRRSGRARQTPLLYARDAHDYVIVASNGGEDRYPGWWHNIRHNPDVEVQVGRERFRCRAQAARGADAARLWAKLTAIYGGYERYRQRTQRPLTVFRLTRRGGVAAP